MIITHKTEIFPLKEHKDFLERCFGARRFFFNVAISELNRRYNFNLKENIKSIKSKEIMALRKEVILSKYREWKLMVPDQILYTSMEDVCFAVESLRKKGKAIKLRKKKDNNTFRIIKSGSGMTFWYENGDKYIGLPQFNRYKLPKLKMAEPLRWDNADIRTVTIKKFAGRYWISITCEIPDLPRMINNNHHLGIDWGVSTYLTCFDGKDILEGDFCKKTLSKLDFRIRKNQKSLARKKKFSKNWYKAKTKLQQFYLNLTNYRHAYIDEVVKELVLNYDTVTMESLNATFFSKNRRLSRLVALKPPYLFKVRLVNKFSQYSKKVFQVPKDFASTLTCNQCGYRRMGDEKLKLGEKIFTCPSCGHKDTRDGNAAKNIYDYKNLEEVILDN